MDIYVMALAAPPDAYDRLLSNREGARVRSEADAAASVTGTHLHAIWPQAGALRLIVEADGDPEEFAGYLAERLEGGEWTSTWRAAPSLEDFPTHLEAGQLSAWIVEMTVPRPTRRCDGCERAGAPPHGPGCPYGRDDDGPPARQTLDRERGGDGSEGRVLEPDEDQEEVVRAPVGAEVH